jgi:hypothetical protein
MFRVELQILDENLIHPIGHVLRTNIVVTSVYKASLRGVGHKNIQT